MGNATCPVVTQADLAHVAQTRESPAHLREHLKVCPECLRLVYAAKDAYDAAHADVEDEEGNLVSLHDIRKKEWRPTPGIELNEWCVVQFKHNSVERVYPMTAQTGDRDSVAEWARRVFGAGDPKHYWEVRPSANFIRVVPG